MGYKHFIALFLLVSVLSSCYVLNTKKHYRKALEKAPYDAIIVPGFPYTESDTTWSDVVKMRMLWSKFLLDKNITKHIIYSGADVHSPYVEGIYMSLYGKALGVPENVILIDTLAHHSSENIFYSFLLAREHGLHKVALATDPFQSGMTSPVRRKMKRIFKQKIDQIPVVIDTLRTLHDLPHPKIDVQIAYRENHISLKEQEGFFKRLGGTLGMKIDWKKYRKEERRKRKELKK